MLASKTSPVYRPRQPHLTPLYQCVQDHYEKLEQVYEERFEKRYGFWRPYFLYDRRLLAESSRQGWETLKLFYQAFAPEAEAMPAAVVAVQTFGEFPEKFHPHLHIICADGYYNEDGTFRKAPRLELSGLEGIFRHKILKILLARGRITGELIELMAGWRHSGFNVFCGPRIWPRQQRAMENLARYIVRASFAQRRMRYRPGETQVRYDSKDGREQKSYDALEWLAAMGSHVPDRGAQSVRYYGHYSNRCRGARRKKNQPEDPFPYILEPDVAGAAARKRWSALIQKVYEVNPLCCPKCQSPMKVISFIHRESIIRRILEHLGLWLANARPQPRAHSPPARYPLLEPASQRPAFAEPFSQLPPKEWDF